MKYNLAFKYRIYPNKEQKLLINKTFGCVRFVYNTILYITNKIYEETGKNKIITPPFDFEYFFFRNFIINDFSSIFYTKILSWMYPFFNFFYKKSNSSPTCRSRRLLAIFLLK